MEPPAGPALKRRVADWDRKRAAKACDGCRRVKEKCEGGVPCYRCVRLQRQCAFQTEDPRSRIKKEDLSMRTKYMEKLVRHYCDIDLDLESLRAAASAVDSRTPSPPSEQHEEEQEKYSVQLLGDNITHYSGEFSYWNFSMRIKQWIEQCVPETASNANVQEYWRAEDLQSPSEASTSLSLLPPRHVADFLVAAFFKHAQTNYLYVERSWLVDNLDRAYGNSATLTRRDVGTVCILFAVLAIGTQYAYLDSLQPAQNQGGPFTEDRVGVLLFQQACKLLPDVITVSSLECVQACLLIGVYTMPLDAAGLSYIYLNLAVTLAVQNGMHRRHPAGMDAMVREMRSRTWWTAYTMASRVGIFHGRPLPIATAEADAQIPLDRADMWPEPANVPIVMATIHLNQILFNVSQAISVFKSRKTGASNTVGRLIQLKEDAHTWWDSLPDIAASRSSMHLKLEYCLVRMLLGRPFLSLGRRSSNSSTPSRTSALVEDCVDAALTIIETCKAIRDSLKLARASYTEFSACRAALLVIITQCLQGTGKAELRQALTDGVSMIKMMSSGGESARSEASLIEFFERAVARLDAAELDVGLGSGYAEFKSWEMMLQNEVGGSSSMAAVGEADLANMMTASAVDWTSVAGMPTVDVFASIFGQGSPDSMESAVQSMWTGT